jgi:uncharacterized protein
VTPGGSTLKERLAAEIRQALKAGQKTRLGALRMLAASVKNREVELRHELTDEELQGVAVGEMRRRTEAIEAYEMAGREDLAAREREERAVLGTYAPSPLSPEETVALVDQAIAVTGASSVKELGKVMGFVMGRAKGRVDGSTVLALVRERLGG